MKLARAIVACLWISGSLLAAATTHAGMRWGLEFGSRFGSYGPGPFQGNSLAAPADENRTRASFDGGALAEWPVGKRFAMATALRYEETSAGRFLYTGVNFNDGTQVFGLWEDRTNRLQGLSLAPSASLRFGPGFSVSFGPELCFLLKAEETSELSRGPVQAQAPALRPQAQIFEQAGNHITIDVTGRYERWIGGLSFGAGWEHAWFHQTWRLNANAHALFGEPFLRGSSPGRINTLRLGLAWLH